MSQWLQQLYDEYRRGHPDAVKGVQHLQHKVKIGCACERDVSVLKGLDRIHIGQGAHAELDESGVYISDDMLRSLLALIVQASRPSSVNRLTAGTASLRQSAGMRQHGGMTISGGYDMMPYFGATHGGATHSAPSGSHFTSVPMASHHAGVSHYGSHHRGSRGGGGGWWGWPGYWGDECYVDAYGRVVCWTAYGWQVVA